MTEERFYVWLWIWIGIALVVFVLLRFITAPYGRHAKTSWGPLIDNKTGWMLMEITLLFSLWYFFEKGSGIQSLANYVIIGLLSFHYLNRSLIFPFRLRTKGKKMPVVIMLMGMSFNVVNGFFFGVYLGELQIYPETWLHSPAFVTGFIVFLSGIILNWRSDNRLIHLRKGDDTGYKIPTGGWFRWVSCPNLLGEIIEWMGFAVLTWSLPGVAFFVWSCANLVPRAIAHHHWYRKTFKDYPTERKAIIPFLI